MLTNTIEVILIKNLNISFKYIAIFKPYKRYIKDYEIDKPLYVTKDKLIPIKYNSNVSVIIKYKHKYYWCLQFEELYKSYKGIIKVQEDNRNNFVMRSLINFNKNLPMLSFEFRSIDYKTNDLKQIIIKDADN